MKPSVKLQTPANSPKTEDNIRGLKPQILPSEATNIKKETATAMTTEELTPEKKNALKKRMSNLMNDTGEAIRCDENSARFNSHAKNLNDMSGNKSSKLWVVLQKPLIPKESPESDEVSYCESRGQSEFVTGSMNLHNTKQLNNPNSKGISLTDAAKENSGHKCHSRVHSFSSSDKKLFDRKKFESLELSFSKIEVLRETLKRNCDLKTNLVDVNLSYMSLGYFPLELLECTSIKFLKLDFNMIKFIPENLALIHSLEFLSISNNYLETLPDSLVNLSHSLKCLNLGKNCITRIGPEITGLINLEVLYLYANPIKYLPLDLVHLRDLKEFAIEWFKYCEPPLSSILRRPGNDQLFDKLWSILDKLKKLKSLQSQVISFFEFINSMSERLPDFTKIDNKKRNIIHVSCLEEEVGIMSILGEQFRSHLNALDYENQTPLTLSLLEGLTRSTRVLIELGANPCVGGGHFGSALHLAVTKLNAQLVDKFLKMNIDPNSMDFQKNSPLHLVFSIFSKNEESASQICEMLLKAGANPNLLNGDQYTCIHLAAKKLQKSAIRFAQQYNLSKSKEIMSAEEAKETLFDFNKRGGVSKWTVLHILTNQGHLDMFEQLTLQQTDLKLNLFKENSNFQTCKEVAYNSFILEKIIKKAEQRWIRNNIISTGPGTGRGSDCIPEISQRHNQMDIHTLIDLTMNKKSDCLQRGKQDVASHFKSISNKLENRLGKDLRLDKEFLMADFLKARNDTEHSVVDYEMSVQTNRHESNRGEHGGFHSVINEVGVHNEVSMLSKKTMESSEDNCADVEEFNVLSGRRNIGPRFEKTNQSMNLSDMRINENNLKSFEKKGKKQTKDERSKLEHRFLLESLCDNPIFIQLNVLSVPISSLNFDIYLKEVKRLDNLVNDNNPCFSEKMKCLLFLWFIHLHINKHIYKFRSNILPLNLYILNEFIRKNPLSISSTHQRDYKELIVNVLLGQLNQLLDKVKKDADREKAENDASEEILRKIAQKHSSVFPNSGTSKLISFDLQMVIPNNMYSYKRKEFDVEMLLLLYLLDLLFEIAPFKVAPKLPPLFKKDSDSVAKSRPLRFLLEFETYQLFHLFTKNQNILRKMINSKEMTKPKASVIKPPNSDSREKKMEASHSANKAESLITHFVRSSKDADQPLRSSNMNKSFVMRREITEEEETPIKRPAGTGNMIVMKNDRKNGLSSSINDVKSVAQKSKDFKVFKKKNPEDVFEEDEEPFRNEKLTKHHHENNDSLKTPFKENKSDKAKGYL